jgi:LPS O-antigen subunit length determinant protein (WzzB/FepE family)
LDALIEDIQPQWEDVFNVLLGALRMQMTTRNSLKILAAVGLAGALAAGVVAFRIPDRYVSTAVMRFIPAGPADSDRQRALDRLQQMTHQIVSDRDTAFRKALRIQLLQTQGGGVPAFSISCEYPDNLKAQAVVREVVARFFRLNQGPSAVEVLEVLDPASLPGRPFYPNRPVAVGVGLLGGAALGLLAVLVRRSTLHSQK